MIELFEILAHEMVHLRQELFGEPGKTAKYHNREFVRMAAEIGLIADLGSGRTIKVTDPFVNVCRAHGVTDPIPDYSVPSADPAIWHESGEKKSNSTLKKWSCRCVPPVNVRVGRTKCDEDTKEHPFDATCNHCGYRFEQVED